MTFSLRSFSLRSFRVLLGAAVLGSALAQSDLKSRLMALLPGSVQSVELLEWQPNEEIVAIRERILQAQRADPRWFREYAASHEDQEVLPWHPKFGVSERDYQKYLSADRGHFAKTGKTTNLVMDKVGTKVIFRGGNGVEALSGLLLDLVSGELRLPEGFTASPIPVNVSVSNSGLGPRKGYAWHINGADTTAKLVLRVQLSLLQFADGSVLMSYNRASAKNSRPLPIVDINVLYGKKAEVSKR